MENFYDMLKIKGITLALRKYSPEGSYFLINISSVTKEVLNIEKLESLPNYWSEEYINELLKNGEIFDSKLILD